MNWMRDITLLAAVVMALAASVLLGCQPSPQGAPASPSPIGAEQFVLARMTDTGFEVSLYHVTLDGSVQETTSVNTETQLRNFGSTTMSPEGSHMVICISPEDDVRDRSMAFIFRVSPTALLAKVALSGWPGNMIWDGEDKFRHYQTIVYELDAPARTSLHQAPDWKAVADGERTWPARKRPEDAVIQNAVERLRAAGVENPFYARISPIVFAAIFNSGTAVATLDGSKIVYFGDINTRYNRSGKSQVIVMTRDSDWKLQTLPTSFPTPRFIHFWNDLLVVETLDDDEKEIVVGFDDNLKEVFRMEARVFLAKGSFPER